MRSARFRNHFKLRYDVLYDTQSFTATVLVYNNPHTKFPKHLNEELKERDRVSLDK